MAVEGKSEDEQLMASMTSKRRDMETRWAVSRYGPFNSLAEMGGVRARLKDRDVDVDMEDAG